MRKNWGYLVGILIVLTLLALIWKHFASFPNSSNSKITTISPTATSSAPSLPQFPISSDSAKTKLLDLKLFFIALNDNGGHGEKIGCGDSIAPVNIQLPETQTPLQAVMQQLLSIKQKTVGPSQLYNSLYLSNLEFKDATINNGVAIIHLTGTSSLGGECDNPRVIAQLEKTARQFSNINSVQIFINDKPLSAVFPLK